MAHLMAQALGLPAAVLSRVLMPMPENIRHDGLLVWWLQAEIEWRGLQDRCIPYGWVVMPFSSS